MGDGADGQAETSMIENPYGGKTRWRTAVPALLQADAVGAATQPLGAGPPSRRVIGDARFPNVSQCSGSFTASRALPIVRKPAVREVARQTGHSVGAVHAVLHEDPEPRADGLKRYLDIAKSAPC